MKKLGQHFLTNKIKLQEIVEALDLKAGDTVIEIGPGHGELTEEFRIQNLGFRIIAIEKDKELIRHLEKKFVQDKNIEIIEGDALKILPKLIDSILRTSDVPSIENNNFRTSDVQKLKIVGNIPFYITGYLLRILGELENKPSLIVLTVQKEVAERICVKPPRMNLLAASVQFWAEPEIADYIPKTDFNPQPKVDSAIIKLRIRNYELGIMDNYYRLIKTLFKQPRKTILNNLASSDKNQKTKEEIVKILEELKINPGDRPQDLNIEQIKKIAGQLKP